MNIDFGKGGGLVPVIVQDVTSRRVLMLGYMNEEALRRTQAEGRVTFYSRSKDRLWTKGESSGHFLTVRSISSDCDNDTLLILAEPAGPTCHTGSESCFGETSGGGLTFLATLARVISERRAAADEGSYTASLFRSGPRRIAQKVGEEAVETVIAALGGPREELRSECADLLFHLLVLLENSGLPLEEVIGELEARHAKKAPR